MTYSCPFCHGPLTGTTSAGLGCLKCNRRYASKYGIPILSKNPDFFYGEIAQPVMHDLIDQTQTLGWDKAFIELLKTTEAGYSSHLLNYVMGESRAGWKYLLDLGPKSKVLDLGCGWGSTSISLSRTVVEVVAMDLTIERLVLLRERARLQGRTNIEYVCGGDTPCLPFPSEYFDAVTLNGVLEWVPETDEGDPRVSQLEFLREIARILRLDGQLYIGIENRLSYRYFLGQREDHTGLRFGALLPRRLANRYSQIVRGKPYRTYTYSMKGYTRLLEEAGFEGHRFYAPIPDYRDFEHIVDLSSSVPVGFYYKPASYKQFIKSLLLKWSGFAKWLCSSYCIVAGKCHSPRNFIERALEHHNGSLGPTHGTWVINKVLRVRRTNTIVAEVVSFSAQQGVSGAVILRVPMEPVSESRVSQNFAALQYIHNCKRFSGAIKTVVPKPLYAGCVDGQAITIESKLGGVPATYLDRVGEDHSMIDELAVKLLLRLHMDSGSLATLDSTWINKLVRKPLDTLEASSCGEHIAGLLSEISQRVEQWLLKRTVPLVFMHGDFWVGNLLVNPEGTSIEGIIDFDRSVEQGLPYVDLLHFLIYRRMELHKASFGQSFMELGLRQAMAPRERRHVMKYLRQMSLPEGLVTPLSILYLVHHSLWHMQKFGGCDQHWLDANVISVFKQAADLLNDKATQPIG